jgi:LPXTG-motif cell wall-anchored protein
MYVVIAILTLALRANAGVVPSTGSSGLPLIAGGAVLLLLGAARFRRRD